MEFPAITLPSFPTLNLSFVLTQQVLFVLFAIFVAFYITVSAILFYHWMSYGMGGRGIHVGEAVYSIVSILVLTIAFLAISYY